MLTSPVLGVHLDLKGVMFKPAYIPQLLADLASQGVNSVLVEYEDIFPFEKPAVNLGKGIDLDIACDRKVQWTRTVLNDFLAAAKKHGIDVIPLQQCLGHFEYIFRWHGYRKFALDKKYPSTVNVDDPKAVALVLEMLRQVIEAHPDSQYIHLGMDEAHALVAHAKKKGRDVVAAFLDHLGKLCDLCEKHGKTPIIWSDMLEDHISPRSLKLFEDFKDRVVLSPWDYGSTGTKIGVGRIAGFRVSREWLREPHNPDAPSIGPGHTYIEDIPQPVRDIVGYDLHGRYFTPMFQTDVWSRLGFRVMGATAIRCSSNLATMPFYNKLADNITAWSKAIKRTNQLGLIATSWARGTSWCPPGYNIDLTWPLTAHLARCMDVIPEPFFGGIPAATVERLVRTLGRSRADWRLEGRTADEMEKLEKKVTSHMHEWRSMILMARALELQRRASYNIEEVDFFHANHRPSDTEWQRRLDEQAQTLKDIATMKKAIDAHFSKRYHGDAYNEWVNDLFDLYVTRIKDCQNICKKKLALAKREYSKR